MSLRIINAADLAEKPLPPSELRPWNDPAEYERPDQPPSTSTQLHEVLCDALLDGDDRRRSQIIHACEMRQLALTLLANAADDDTGDPLLDALTWISGCILTNYNQDRPQHVH